MNTCYIVSNSYCKEASHGRNRNHRATVDTARAFGVSPTATGAGRLADPTRVADPQPIADPGRITANGAGPMMISSVVRGRSSRGAASTKPATAHLPNGLPAELTKSLVSLWTQYAGKAPSRAQTEIRGNVVTCVLVDAVGDYNRSMMAPQTGDTVRGAGKLTPAAYKREAVAAVVRLTRQRVASFISSHDRDTDVATEVFTLEPSFNRGAPSLADRRRGRDFRLFSPRVV
jgi:Na+-translocating membrane potential-generating system (MpsC)